MKKLSFKKVVGGIVISIIVLGIFSFSLNYFVASTGEKYILPEISDLPEIEVVLVLGARVYREGGLSDVLKDRMLTALKLYEKGKVKKFLLSGDHGREEYDEVNAMNDFLLEKGVSAKDIFLDHAGFDTYDSIYRAKEIFEIDSMVIVTQAFHLPRALYVARALGIEAYGFAADRQVYVSARYNELREILARTKSFFDVMLKAKPMYLGEKIPISGDSAKSKD